MHLPIASVVDDCILVVCAVASVVSLSVVKTALKEIKQPFD